MTYQVVDSFTVTTSRPAVIPGDGTTLEPGLWFIVEPPLPNEICAPVPTSYVTITEPSGILKQYEVVVARLNASRVLALQFRDVHKEDIPRLSVISWQEA